MQVKIDKIRPFPYQSGDSLSQESSDKAACAAQKTQR